MKKGLVVAFVFVFFLAIAQAKQGVVQQKGISDQIVGGDISELSAGDISGLELMREEEKLAKDVYLELYDVWNLAIFSNIAESEQTHTEAIARLMEAYDLEDPVVSDERGIFVSEELSDLYVSLVEQGSASLLDGLIVGASVEDLDIKDLSDLLEVSENEDIVLVYENLRKGSRNHLRSFVALIESNGGTYEAQYISQEELEEIIGSERETGRILDENSGIMADFQNQLMRQNSYAGTGGNQMRVQQEGGQFMIQSQTRSVNCPVCEGLTQQGEFLQARLSNGRNAEIKIMPEVASQTALERLRLRNCDENCVIELKEVGVGQQARLAYEVKTQKNSRVFGLFSAKMDVSADVDAENGELIRVRKPWWAFLASEE